MGSSASGAGTPAGRLEARLLVVEDEPTILELLSGSLRFAGFDVLTAASGREALRVAAAARPDLILLDVNRPLDRHPADLSSIAAQAVLAARLIQPDRPITLNADSPVIVQADAERLRQVIDNLIGNALQHTPGGSAVTVTVQDRAGHAQLTVADNGPGMTADQASRVFERFYRTDPARSRARGGTGLGLSIAAALTAAHAGTVTVDTQPGRGAAFRVTLPLAMPPSEPTSRR